MPVATPDRGYLMTRNSLVVHQTYGGARFWYADLPAIVIKAAVLAFSLPGSKLANLRAGAVPATRRGRAQGRLGDLEAGRRSGCVTRFRAA